jgi:hypothetical protein
MYWSIRKLRGLHTVCVVIQGSRCSLHILISSEIVDFISHEIFYQCQKIVLYTLPQFENMYCFWHGLSEYSLHFVFQKQGCEQYMLKHTSQKSWSLIILIALTDHRLAECETNCTMITHISRHVSVAAALHQGIPSETGCCNMIRMNLCLYMPPYIANCIMKPMFWYMYYVCL